jgi:hypothetical protein
MPFRRAQTIVEALLSMVLIVIISPLFLQVLASMNRFPNYFIERQNNIGLIQLRRLISLGHSHRITQQSLCMNYRDEETCFELYQDKLRQYPGTQFYLIGIDDLSFRWHNHWIILELDVNGQKKDYGLMYVK